ncbi:MAG TPA: SbcC/MukB-like Walker B domain-containing protein [Candidatus Micrarchaeaceae archaeon]|nr:SbcC/MukB-like Walker B domain-containing protein [Candidatus Micrarchaeaceae archaeon]
MGEELRARQADVSNLRDRQQRLADEVASYPSRHEYRQAYREAERAAVKLDSAQTLLVQLREQESQITVRLQRARTAFSTRASELSLSAHVDRLPQLLDAIGDYREQVTDLAWAASTLLARRDAADKVASVVELHKGRLQQEVERVERLRRDNVRAQAHVEELERSVAGQAALDALARVDDLKAELQRLEVAIEARAAKIRDLVKAVAAADGRLQVLGEKHKESTERRAKAAEQIALLAKRGAVDLALNLELVVDGEWSMSRALDLARHQIEPALQNEPIHPDAINNAHSNLVNAFTDLARSLYEYAPALDWPDGIPRTVATYNQVSVDIRVLRQRLREEIESQRRLLTEKEKDIFEHFLMADLANHLRERILRARRQVQEINENLRAHPTTSGMTLSLRLTEEVEDSDEKLALEYLMKDPSLLRDHERELLRAFFQRRIAAARVQEGNQTWREHLTEALDYRRWHRLSIHQHLDGKTAPFTDARYAAGSGGEKSVSIHQPLFAAAATYYDSASMAWAPRLIVLDEAFAGIDFPTRGRCLEMAEQFDLDLVMTSYEEMGTHAELPALAIYQMVRDPARRGVYCERWIWNGHQLQLAEEG